MPARTTAGEQSAVHFLALKVIKLKRRNRLRLRYRRKSLFWLRPMCRVWRGSFPNAFQQDSGESPRRLFGRMEFPGHRDCPGTPRSSVQAPYPQRNQDKPGKHRRADPCVSEYKIGLITVIKRRRSRVQWHIGFLFCVWLPDVDGESLRRIFSGRDGCRKFLATLHQHLRQRINSPFIHILPRQQDPRL